ncbi:MAG: response regulator [Colwellia polaris]|jgi:two-component system chemotaxis response regulator CheY|uniref:response regulator n=1 Tax=Colwellia polaris TaxID=326537 RepID=UPI000A16E517|nr:response regulator [Colwellia polaris]|tara:strand:- start:2890 stop:3255 length:366 start_codon:yes stop_codon:yes gene_type:complete
MSTRVLICDDSNLARKQVLRSLPENLSTDVQLAKDGQEALDILRNQHIDILFLDLTMPIIDGLGVLQALKDEEINLPVFVISADVQPEMQNRVLALGAKAFLRKPMQLDTLNEHLKSHGFL